MACRPKTAAAGQKATLLNTNASGRIELSDDVLHLAIYRDLGNLGMARHQLRSIKRDFKVSAATTVRSERGRQAAPRMLPFGCAEGRQILTRPRGADPQCGVIRTTVERRVSACATA